MIRKNVLFIFKESINNIAKHSNASTVEVTSSRTADGFRVVIKDDGQGFGNESVARGSGLRYMKMRAEKIGAELNIDSRLHGVAI